MNSKYKKKFRRALEQQNEVGQQPYQQFLRMNGLTKVTPVSLTELLSGKPST